MVHMPLPEMWLTRYRMNTKWSQRIKWNRKKTDIEGKRLPLNVSWENNNTVDELIAYVQNENIVTHCIAAENPNPFHLRI